MLHSMNNNNSYGGAIIFIYKCFFYLIAFVNANSSNERTNSCIKLHALRNFLSFSTLEPSGILFFNSFPICIVYTREFSSRFSSEFMSCRESTYLWKCSRVLSRSQ